MKFQKYFSGIYIKQAMPALVIAVLLAGCSGSSDPSSPETESSTDGMISVPDANNGPVVSDPLTQNSIAVSFDITVPYYLSDELRLELSWGDINLTADWVGGQHWTATGEFPTETTQPLAITFYDNFGALELARHSQEFRVGSNVGEAVQITAEQFDANLFDSDGDGVNNLLELNAGTNPLEDEDALLYISDAYALGNSFSQYSRLSVSDEFESRVPDARPFVDVVTTEPQLNGQSQQIVGDFNFNIDTDGNGTLTLNDINNISRFVPALSATRTHSDDSISWTGEVVTSDSEYVHRENVTSTVSIIDENTRRFVQELSGSNLGTFHYRWEISANLVGTLIEDSALCKPVSGTVSTTSSISFNQNSSSATSISKGIDDPYWRVVETRNDSDVTEFFARELRLVYNSDNPDSANFKCDFVDF